MKLRDIINSACDVRKYMVVDLDPEDREELTYHLDEEDIDEVLKYSKIYVKADFNDTEIIPFDMHKHLAGYTYGINSHPIIVRKILEEHFENKLAEDTTMNADSDVRQIVEEVSNDNHDLYQKLIKHLEQTYLAKNKDYGNSFEESLDEFGEIAGIVRIGDKFNRVKSLTKTKKLNVVDESKVDTFLDMANYCIMQAMWLMKQQRNL